MVQVERFHPNLSGRSVLLVESRPALKGFVAAVNSLERMQVYYDLSVPSDLNQYMEDRRIEVAILHSGHTSDQHPILEAFKSGKKIVVIERVIGVSEEMSGTYRKFSESGIPTVPKQGNYISAALDRLSEMLKKSEE